MNIQAIDYLVHFSNILMLLSYSVRDILWLRWFAVAAALTNIPYFLVLPERLWPPVALVHKVARAVRQYHGAGMTSGTGGRGGMGIRYDSADAEAINKRSSGPVC